MASFANVRHLQLFITSLINLTVFNLRYWLVELRIFLYSLTKNELKNCLVGVAYFNGNTIVGGKLMDTP